MRITSGVHMPKRATKDKISQVAARRNALVEPDEGYVVGANMHRS